MHKFLTKYGLAVQIAILVSVPFAVFVFAGSAADTVSLWLTAFAAECFLLEPSIHSGEDFSVARRRVLDRMIHDPLFYFFVVAIVFAGVRAANAGLDTVYDPETSTWSIATPAVSFLPSAAGDAGFSSLCVTLAAAVTVMALRHGLGRSARVFCLFAAAAGVGLTGVAAAVAVCSGAESLVVKSMRTFADGSAIGDVVGIWLLVSVSIAGLADISANPRLAWSATLTAFMGNVAGLVFLASPLTALLYLVVAFGFALFMFYHIVVRVSFPSVVRALAVSLVAVIVPIMA